MAKGKKSSGKEYTSQGSRRSSIKTASSWSSGDRILFKMKALAAGKDVYFTIANPNKEQTNKPFIRQKVDGKMFVRRRQYAHAAPNQENS